MNSNTHSEFLYLLRAFTISVLIVGIALVVLSASQVLTGQVTGQGSSLFSYRFVEHEATLEAAAFHFAPSLITSQPDFRMQLLMGMLLVLLGFAMHALYIVKLKKRK